MIPILFDQSETLISGVGNRFLGNGLGRLDAISCIVKEELNGIYELEMTYPVTGYLFHELQEKRFIYGVVNEAGSKQAFRIYKITKPLNGKIKVYAQHISYDLTGIPIKPYTAEGITRSLRGLQYAFDPADIGEKFALVSHDFTFTSIGINNESSIFTLPTIRSARACLGGVDGSILDVFSGSGSVEYEYDMYLVKAHAHRGTDNGVEIRYGKNLQELTIETTDEAQYSGVVAFWYNEESETDRIVYSAVQATDTASEFDTARILLVDASAEFEDAPSVAELNTYADAYRIRNNVGNKKKTLDLSYVALWQTQEYSTMQNLERIKLGDTVHVVYTDYDVTHDFEVIKTEYDMLKERYNYLTLGNAKSSFSSVIQQKIDSSVGAASTSMTQYVNGQVGNAIQQMVGVTSQLEESLLTSTRKITGVDGGYVVLDINEDNGQPYRILIMDQPDKENATNVIQLNQEGIGFSTEGVDGPFTSAWTIDGEFDAQFIKAATLNVNEAIVGSIHAEHLDLSVQNATNLVTNHIYNESDGLHIVEYVPENPDDPESSLVMSNYQSVFTSRGMKVTDNITSEDTLVAEGDTVTAVNLTAKQYLRIDSGSTKSRFQEFYSATDQEYMFGCFWEETT